MWRFPFTPANLALVEWSVIGGNLGTVLPVVFISVVVLLLSVSGQELVVKQDMDLDRELVAAGTHIMQQGDEPDNIYFVESGQATAQLEWEDQEPIRLETMRGGQVVGEIGFYLGAPRTASVVADEPPVIYRLSMARLRQLERDDPETAVTFHNLIACLLAERASHLIRMADALLRG